MLAIKKKLHEYVVRKGFSIIELVAVLDRNGDKEISLAEFIQETKTFLDDPEAVSLFKAIDHDNSGSLTPDEIVVELASVSASIILSKVKEATISNKMTA